MQLILEKTFDDYMTSGESTVAELLASDSPLVRELRESYRYFAQTLWTDAPDINPVSSVLAINAHMHLMAAIRIAMTGHAGAIFPTLRTALEYACYAFLITDDPALAAVWTNRHKSREALKASRNKFTGAVTATSKKLNEGQPGSADWIAEAYDTAIDFGAHPNPRGVFTHISWGEETSSHVAMNVTGLYSADQFETTRSLMACLDFSLAIAVVLTNCRKEFSEAIQIELTAMHDRRESVISELIRIGAIVVRGYPHENQQEGDRSNGE